MREQDKTLEEEPSEVEISNQPNKEFKVMIINNSGEEWMNTVRISTKS